MARSQDDGGFCKYILAMSLVIYERREYCQNGFVYLLDDEEKTAWIKQGRIKRCRRYRLPDHVMVDGISYRIAEEKSVVISREEGFAEAGRLNFAEDWKHSEQNYATDLNSDAVVYVNLNDRSKIYLRWSGHFLLCKRERNILLK